MKKACVLFLFIAYVNAAFSQRLASQVLKDNTPPAEKKLMLSIGGSYAYTLLNLNIGYLRDTQSNANDVRLYFTRGRYRVVANYEKVRAVDLKPDWLNVRSTYYDLCLHVLDFSSTIMYPIVGITYENSSAYYTGANYITRLLPYKNTDYKRNYWGVTLGGGLEVNVLTHLKLFGELRIRIMKNDEKTSFNDMVLGGGIKLDLFSLNLKRIFRKPNDKYHWF